MPACTIKPADLRWQIRVVGNDLIRSCGKKHFYTVQEVKNSNRRQNIKYDVGCWSHAFFNSQADFDEYHKRIGENCDYIVMKKIVRQETAETVASSEVSLSDLSPDLDFTLSWLELPDVDFSLFDFFDV